MKHHPMQRLTAIVAAALLLLTSALADSPILRRDAVSALLDSVGRAVIPVTQQVLRTFEDAAALPDELIDDYSRAANYAIARRMDSNRLEPDAVLTRAELLAMVGWAAEPKLDGNVDTVEAFSDLPDWSVAPIARLMDAGWLDLYTSGSLARTDGTLGANEAATQEELIYFTAMLTELYNTITPGESFYGYANDQWIRNRELPEVNLDLPHGVIRDIGTKWSAQSDCQANLTAQQNAVIAGIMDGSIPCEKGSAAQRFRDMMEICMQGSFIDLYTNGVTGYGAELMERIKHAESMTDLLKMSSDIYCETGTPTLIEFVALNGIEGSGSYVLSYYLSDVTPYLCAWIDYFHQDGARAGMIQYLRKVGQLFDITLTTEEAESLYTYLARVWDGRTNEMFSQYKLQHLGELLTGTLDTTNLLPTLQAHPEIDAEALTYVDGCAPARFMSAAEVFASCPSLHLEELMQATGLGAVQTIYVLDPSQLSAIEAFFGNNDNLNAAKLLVMATLCQNMMCRMDADYLSFFDESRNRLVAEAFDFTLEDDAAFCQMDAAAVRETAVPDEIADDMSFTGVDVYGFDDAASRMEDALSMVTDLMPEIIGEVYAECCVDQDAVSNVERMVDMIIGGYIARFQRNTWMDESSRNAALDKLYQMRSFVSFPKGKYVPEITPMSEGGTFLSNMLACKRNKLRCLAAACTDPDYRSLYPDIKANEVGAYNIWQLNSFYILAGMIQKPYYDPDRSFAGNLGAIGSVIAHEIGHAFDNIGAQYDAHGDQRAWWTEKDAASFEAFQEAFIEYYSNFMITEDKFQDSKISLSENMADFAGICIIMDLLEGDPVAQREALKGYAGNFAALCSDALKTDPMAVSDEHAAANVRTDAVIASLDVFYELYDIDENDPMYVAPEERLKLW